jgi:hypothetical protein
MRQILAIPLLMLVVACTVNKSSPAPPPPATPHWQIASGPNGDLLLNTDTGETWSRVTERPKAGEQYWHSYWLPLGRPDHATTQP